MVNHDSDGILSMPGDSRTRSPRRPRAVSGGSLAAPAGPVQQSLASFEQELSLDELRCAFDSFITDNWDYDTTSALLALLRNGM